MTHAGRVVARAAAAKHLTKAEIVEEGSGSWPSPVFPSSPQPGSGRLVRVGPQPVKQAKMTSSTPSFRGAFGKRTLLATMPVGILALEVLHGLHRLLLLSIKSDSEHKSGDACLTAADAECYDAAGAECYDSVGICRRPKVPGDNTILLRGFPKENTLPDVRSQVRNGEVRRRNRNLGLDNGPPSRRSEDNGSAGFRGKLPEKGNHPEISQPCRT